MSILLSGVITGRRNGVLISPVHDPTTEAEVEALFSTPKRYHHSVPYVERILYIPPPKLCHAFHQRALEHWLEVQALRRRERQAQAPNTPRRPQPSPSPDNGVWKMWLRDMRDYPQSGGKFKHIGIPLVCQGYQTAHLDSARFCVRQGTARNDNDPKRPSNVSFGMVTDPYYGHPYSRIYDTVLTPSR